MTFVAVAIFAATVLVSVGTAGLLLAWWTRRRYAHKGPSDLHYVVCAGTLLGSASLGIWLAWTLLAALGYPG
jgi:hypothetical protein